MLPKSKRNKDGPESSGPEPGSPARNSSDTVLGKIKARIGTVDEEEISDSRISKFVPALGKRRDKKRHRARKSTEDNTEEFHGRTGKGSTSNSLGTSESLSTLNDERSSLLTSDSEEEIQRSTLSPPPLLSHESHAGYLTSTSPEIKSITIPPSPALSQVNSPSPKTVQPPTEAATVSVVSDDSRRKLASMSDNYPASETTDVIKSYPEVSAEYSQPLQSLVTSQKKGREGTSSFASRDNTLSLNDSPSRPASSPGMGAFLNQGTVNGVPSRRASRASESTFLSTGTQAMDQYTTEGYSSPYPIIAFHKTSPSNESINAPTTTITPPTPINGIDLERVQSSLAKDHIASEHNDSSKTISPSGSLISHRSVHSESTSYKSSKLSQSITAPLTSTIEEAKTTELRNTLGNNTGGFFSSVFSAAQNAANTLSNSLANSSPRPRNTIFHNPPNDGEEHPKTDDINFKGNENLPMEPTRSLAIETIGSGELSLSHLGISSDSQPIVPTSTGPISPILDDGGGRSRSGTVIRREEIVARAEDISAARAISAAYDSKTEGKPASTPVAEDVPPRLKALSIHEQSLAGEKTPPNGSIHEGESSLWRSGSLRNRVDRARRRQRNSSGATTVNTAIATNHGALASPSNGNTPKMTGFAVASKKRNRDFHQLFRSVPEDDYLIEDYSCALQRDIILAGRIYISEGHVCFSSNILGWVTTLVISFDEVVSVEKENTAMVFPNAIAVQTLHARHTFRSLLSRDATYDLLIGIWKINHPSLQSSENGVTLLNGSTGSKTEKVEVYESDDYSEGSDADEEVYDEDDEEGDDQRADGEQSLAGTREESITDSDIAESIPKATVARKPSALGIIAGQASGIPPTLGENKAAEKASVAAALSADFPGPATHAPTECGDLSTHYDKILKDEVVSAPLGKVYSMIFGAASGGFMTRWLLDEVKVTDLQMKDDERGLNDDNKTRSFSYIKPLNASIGPRTTKCVITEQLEAFDLEKAVTVNVTTQTPDVPSGNVFSTKTRYCLMWGPGNGTRVIMCCMIEWTGKSWIKGAIEKGANDGQTTYANDLMKALRSGVSTRSRANTSGSKIKKGRKRKGDGETLKPLSGASLDQKKPPDWRLLDPIFAAFGRVLAICRPLLNANSVIYMLLFLLIVSWFRNSRARYGTPASKDYLASRLTQPQQIAAYEELWRMEEETLWDWLEERVGIPEGFVPPTGEKRGKVDRSDHQQATRGATQKRKEHNTPGMIRNGLRSMGDLEVEWAISVTEDKLKRLKQAISSSRGEQRSSDTHPSNVEYDNGADELPPQNLEQWEKLIKDGL